nr:hypothetical protein Iba_chr05cCG10340 [Ipomoea batatas]
MSSRDFRVLRDPARSFAQMFLPSTTPANKYLPEGKPPLIKSMVLVPRIKSKPKAVTPFKAVRVLNASAGISAKDRGISSSHGEVSIKSNLTASPVVPWGYSTEHGSGVEHLPPSADPQHCSSHPKKIQERI